MANLCTIDCDGTSFILSIPSDREGVDAHEVCIPVEKPELLARVLSDRRRLLARDEARTIGSPASPTAHMIEAYLRSHEPTRQSEAEREKAEAAAQRVRDFEAKYGDDFAEIEL